jgi:hypothetical protein
MRFWVRLVGLLAGVYALVAGALNGKKWPSEKAWSVGAPLFWSWVAAGIVALVAAFVEAGLARRAAQGVRDNDLYITCRLIAGKIIGHCVPAGLDANLLTVSIWRTKKDNTFDRKAKFLLPLEFPPSGVDWKKGKGVAGWAWASGKPNHWARLTDRSTMSATYYDGLSEDKRLGMTYAEWGLVTAYKGVVVSALYATTGASLLGFLVIDYRGPVRPKGTDLVFCIRDAVINDGEIGQLRGGLVRRLQEKA